MDNEAYVREFNLQLTDSLNKIHHLFVNMFFFFPVYQLFKDWKKTSFPSFTTPTWFSIQNESVIVLD